MWAIHRIFSAITFVAVTTSILADCGAGYVADCLDGSNKNLAMVAVNCWSGWEHSQKKTVRDERTRTKPKSVSTENERG